MRKLAPSQAGFTWLELLVVFVCIGLLVILALLFRNS